ncbi:NUDIX hydrolase [Rhodovulum sp. DZ06]|uniref:NUDIX hydrolase n=1 Tax=Rhodovulum sp. DZ06 TaxID=3425126 RepID=UPI003D352738
MGKLIDKVGLALVRDGKVLLARSRGDAFFQIPGGKVEASDADDVAALVREIREELGVEVDPASAHLLGLFSAEAAGKPGVVVQVKLYRAAIAGDPAPCAEIEELLWHPLSEDLSAGTDTVRLKIIPYLRGAAG